MSDAAPAAKWMQAQIDRDGCLYQDDVIDHLVKSSQEDLLRENADGNLVLGTALLNAFRKLNAETVVWVKPDFYWRTRVAEDEPGREARG
ncbi:MAG: hypothetical protein EPN56_02405 [Rhodanobacter sp.]|nr:MAG: hypothetical protein EPN78_06015 [Rhodanobacter sp.]TAM14646.1 MAG: hypothetical protein EPN66_02170 [Rhodanobacter sp.]TAM37438.1 MAG: hypothetical protein EPN56_02405 [Rhodanobacter sp.]